MSSSLSKVMVQQPPERTLLSIRNPWLFQERSNGVNTQIQLAKYLGAKRIVLLGVDFNFSVPESATGSSKEIISEGELNHFHKDYRLPGERWNLPNLEKQVLAFEAARVACEASGIEILNATKGTKLKVFKCIDIADVL